MLVLIVSFDFDCSWNSLKKERILQLISERILILTGSRVFEKISNISFCEKEWFEDSLSDTYCLLSDDRGAALRITKSSDMKSYELMLEKDILLSMLSPGAGQSHFDNLILELKNIIQNN